MRKLSVRVVLVPEPSFLDEGMCRSQRRLARGQSIGDQILLLRGLHASHLGLQWPWLAKLDLELGFRGFWHRFCCCDISLQLLLDKDSFDPPPQADIFSNGVLTLLIVVIFCSDVFLSKWILALFCSFWYT